MIGKVQRGKSFGPLAAYLFREEGRARADGSREQHEDPRVVAGTVTAREPKEMAREMSEQAATNRRVRTPVFHASLRVPPEERGALDDEEWGRAAESYAERMGFQNAPWAAVRHADDHVHVIASRVDYDGHTVSASHDFERSRKAVRAVEGEHGLESAANRQAKRTSTLDRGERESHQRRRDAGEIVGRQEPPRVQLRAAMERALGQATSREDYEARCARAGVTLRESEHEKQDGSVVRGYSAALAGHEDEHGEQVWTHASRVHQSLSHGRVGVSLERDQEHERERDREHERGGLEL